MPTCIGSFCSLWQLCMYRVNTSNLVIIWAVFWHKYRSISYIEMSDCPNLRVNEFLMSIPNDSRTIDGLGPYQTFILHETHDDLTMDEYIFTSRYESKQSTTFRCSGVLEPEFVPSIVLRKVPQLSTLSSLVQWTTTGHASIITWNFHSTTLRALDLPRRDTPSCTLG